MTQTVDRYHVLALTRSTAKLFCGTRASLDWVENVPIPPTIREALGDELTEPELRSASYGGTGQAMFHGHGSRDAETDKDRDRFFRAVATAVEKHCSEPTRLPLVLIALTENQSHYRQLSRDRFLLEQGLEQDPASMTLAEMHQKTWALMLKQIEQQRAEYLEKLGTAMSNRKGSAIVTDIAREAANGRVDLMLLEEGAQLPGRIDFSTGQINEESLSDARIDDAYGDLAQMVTARGGTVRVLPQGALPDPSKVAAIYRHWNSIRLLSGHFSVESSGRFLESSPTALFSVPLSFKAI
jgi:hypothetical protein